MLATWSRRVRRQNFAMSDNMWGDTYGPSTPDPLNMFAGQTNGIVVGAGTSGNELPDGQVASR